MPGRQEKFAQFRVQTTGREEHDVGLKRPIERIFVLSDELEQPRMIDLGGQGFVSIREGIPDKMLLQSKAIAYPTIMCAIEEEDGTSTFSGPGANTGEVFSLGPLVGVFPLNTAHRSLMRFDLTVLGTDAVLKSAYLRLVTKAINGSSLVVSMGGAITRCTRSNWVEDEATTGVFKTASNWTLPGGDFSNLDDVAGEVYFVFPSEINRLVGVDGPPEIDPDKGINITELAQDAIDNRSGSLDLFFQATIALTGANTISEWNSLGDQNVTCYDLSEVDINRRPALILDVGKVLQ